MYQGHLKDKMNRAKNLTKSRVATHHSSKYKQSYKEFLSHRGSSKSMLTKSQSNQEIEHILAAKTHAIYNKKEVAPKTREQQIMQSPGSNAMGSNDDFSRDIGNQSFNMMNSPHIKGDQPMKLEEIESPQKQQVQEQNLKANTMTHQTSKLITKQ